MGRKKKATIDTARQADTLEHYVRELLRRVESLENRVYELDCELYKLAHRDDEDDDDDLI